ERSLGRLEGKRPSANKGKGEKIGETRRKRSFANKGKGEKLEETRRKRKSWRKDDQIVQKGLEEVTGDYST
ncbi:unnamed protein product, partial [Linum tenue]